MAKKEELNKANARKYASRIMVQTAIADIISLTSLFIPIKGKNFFEALGAVFGGASLTAQSGIHIFLSVLLIVTVAVVWIKRCTFKDKAKINTESVAAIFDSPFVRFFKYYATSHYGLIGAIFLLMFAMFNISFDNPDVIYEILLYEFYMIIVAIVAIICLFRIKPINVAIAELQKKYPQYALSQKAAKEFGISVDDKLNDKSGAQSYVDQKSNLDALLKYKKLYESGAITEEEYNAKKEELLNK